MSEEDFGVKGLIYSELMIHIIDDPSLYFMVKYSYQFDICSLLHMHHQPVL